MPTRRTVIRAKCLTETATVALSIFIVVPAQVRADDARAEIMMIYLRFSRGLLLAFARAAAMTAA
jgi:hypothetical protein